MPRILARRRAMPAALVAATVVFLCLCAGSAHAATYDITGCNPDGSAQGWTAYVPAATYQSWGVCPSNGDLNNRGIGVANRANVGVLGYTSGRLMFSAPTGTSLVGVGAGVRIQRWDGGYWVGLFTGSGQPLFGYWANDGNGAVASSYTPYSWFNLNHESDVHLEVGCSSLCDTAWMGSSGLRAEAQMYDPITVRIEDDAAPTETLTGGGLVSYAYATGTQTITYNASDASGIRATRLYVDGSKLRDDTRSCSFEQPVPCSNVSGGSYSVDTRALSDGSHTVKIETVDSAGNATSQSRSISVDNAAPASPTLTVTGGESWRSSNDFTVGWTNPAGQTAPIAKGYYEVCRADQPANCQPTGFQSGANISSLSSLTVPAEGDYTVSVWLEDAAGNTSAANSSAPVHLRFDDTDPGRAEPRPVDGWLNAGDVANGYDERIALADGQAAGPSGLAGFAVSTDGSEPGTTPDVSPDGVLHLSDLPEGTLTVKARAISNSGVASTRVGSTVLSIDKTAPTVDTANAPDPDVWQPHSVELTLSGHDQADLSGMTGGHLTYAVDGGEAKTVAGDSAAVRVDSDGRHTVTYSATDAAGNSSAERSMSFRIDATPPGDAALSDPPRWLNADDADTYMQGVRLADPADAPLSGLAGFSITTDGDAPDATPETAGDKMDLGRLPEGTTIVKARAVSGSGLASARVASVDVHVDRTAPDVSLTSEPAPDAWHRDAVELELRASDALSGMEDGSIVYGVDDQAERTVPGNSAKVLVDGDGHHTVRYYAVDAAGNRSDLKLTGFRIDTGKPGAATPEDSPGWITASGKYIEHIRLADGEPLPVSGLAGYSVTTDGSTPDDAPETDADGSFPIDDLQEGVTTVKARAISGAGVASDTVGVGTIKVDRTAPAVELERPDGKSLTVQVSDTLSGVRSAVLELRAAGTTEWRPLHSELGDGRLRALLDVEPGTYELRATAVDEAGNRREATTFAGGGQATVIIEPDAPSDPPAALAIGATPPPVPQAAGSPAAPDVHCAAKTKRAKRKHRARHVAKHRRPHASKHHRRRAHKRHANSTCHPGGEKHRHRHLRRKTHRPARRSAG